MILPTHIRAIDRAFRALAVHLPNGRPGLPWGRLRPRTTLHWVSCLVLWAIVVAYIGVWVNAQSGYLFDPLLQNDDARTSLFPFHEYGPDATMGDDPIARDIVVRLPPGFWLQYRVLTPLVGLYWASKVVQGICLGIVAWTAVILCRSRRVGLAGALLLVFLMLHTPYVINRIGGGFPRAFTFPLAALWTAGVIAASPRARFAAVVTAAFMNPIAALLLLGADGVYALRGRDFKRYAVLAAVCCACVLPQAVRHSYHGRVHTLAEARQDPVFVHSPRRVLPFKSPLAVGTRYFAHPLHANGRGPMVDAWDGLGGFGALAVAAGLVALVVSRRVPLPWAAIALIVSAIVCYVAARVFAFRLYSPVRYLEYGCVASSLALIVSTVGLLLPRLRHRGQRSAIRNFTAFSAIALVWLVAGDGIIRKDTPVRDSVVNHNGMSIDERDEADLYAFIRTLPPDSRLALHPRDGAGVSYWTGRATTEHYETLTPWWVESWRRARTRTRDTLRALYADDPEVLLEYCRRYGISHLLINTGRYGRDYRAAARVFPPFDAYIDDLLADVDRKQLVIPRLSDPSTVVYHQAPWIVLDVGRIREFTEGVQATAAAGSPRDG